MSSRTILRYGFLILTLSAPIESVWAQDKPLPGKQFLPDFSHVQTILIHTTASHLGHPVPSDGIANTVRHRLQAIGYDTTMNPSQPHDIVILVNCREPTPSHEFEVPPCLFHYGTDERDHDWHRIDRIIYSDGVAALRQAQNKPLNPESLPYSRQFLRCYDFPLLFAAEWAQVPRLLHILDKPGTNPTRQKKILFLLGEIQAESAFPRLLAALSDSHLRIPGIEALGNFGARAQPHLLQLLQSTSNPRLKAATIHSLGHIGALTGDTGLTPLYIKMLEDPGTEITVQTEIVLALGKAPDFRAFSVLAKLERAVWTTRTPSRELQRLRDAIDWSIREVRQGGHTDDY